MRGLKKWRPRRHASVEVSEAKGIRTLHLGGDAIQSAIRLAAPHGLELHYTRAMMAFLLFHPAPRDVLMIGLGGGSIARFVHALMPATRMTAVEVNPRVVAAARSYFGLPADDERLTVEIADGGAYVPAHPDSADVLLLDAFEDGESVKALATRAFYDACRAALRRGGLLAVNFIADEPRFGKALARIEQSFDGRVLCMPAADRVNIIVFAFRGGPSRLGIDALQRRARTLGRRYGLPFEVNVHDLLAMNARTTSYLLVGRSLRDHY